MFFFFLCGTLTNLWVRAIAVNSTFFSDETHVWDTHMSLKCFLFMLYTHEFMGMSCCRQFNLLLGRNSCLGYINVSQMFFLEQLQNTPQLIYMSLNKNSVYCVMPRSSKPPDTCKWGGNELRGILKFSLFFYTVHSRIYGYELLPSLVSARKVTFGSTVSCKWTRQLPYLNSINSSFSLN